MPKILHLTEPKSDYNTLNINSVLVYSIDQNLTSDQYHTSLGDLSSNDIIFLANQFDEINFVSNGFDLKSDIFKETIILLNFLSHRKKITNFKIAEKINFATLTTHNNLEDKKLWVYGCSHSHGVGLDHEDFRYSNIIAKDLKLPLVSITKPGSSIEWSLCQIINSDIRPDDIVIWQITTPERVTLCESYNGQTRNWILKDCPNQFAVMFYDDLQLFYKHISCLNLGIQFLKSKNIKFILTSLDNFGELFYRCINEYSKHKEYCFIPDTYKDFGNDNIHAGPRSHNYLSECIINHYRLLYNV